MSIRAKLSLAEKFLNWYPHHTKLYIRGQRGKDWATQRELDQELFDQLCDFFARHGVDGPVTCADCDTPFSEPGDERATEAARACPRCQGRGVI